MNATQPGVIADVKDLSLAWLSSALGQPVDSYSTEEIVDEGYASRMYRIRVTGQAGIPASLILKLATLQEVQRELLDENLIFREVTFYRDYASRLAGTGLLPEIYCAATDGNNLQLTLLMEDLGDIPHKPFLENLENSLAAVGVLAQVHAAFWESDLLDDPALAPVDSEVTVANLEELLSDNLAAEAAASYSYPYLRKCMRHLLKLVKWVISDADHFAGAKTLVHGDFHARNVHIVGDRPVLFDWQVTERGRPARDIAYWLLTSVDVNDAARFKPQLIDHYLQVLKDHGVDYPMKTFNKDFNDAVGQLVPRMFCYQTLVTMNERDQHEVVNFLDRADQMARAHHMLAQLVVGRITIPPLMMVLRLLGLRKPPKAG